jgi:hypothetical protein
VGLILNACLKDNTLTFHLLADRGVIMDELWKIILNAWRSSFEPYLTPLWDSIVVWRGLGLTLVVALMVAYRNRDRLRAWLIEEPRKVMRDRLIFKQVNAILTEETLYAQLEALPHDRTSMARLERLRSFLSAEGNQFFSRTISETSNQLVESLSSLNAFLTGSVTTDPNELRDLSGRVRDTYRAFRAAVRHTLIV